MSVVIQYEEAGPWRKKLTIEVPAPAVEAETGRVVKELIRTIDLPGFRRGKVPASLIHKRFFGEIEHRVTEKLVPRYWHQAEAEKNIDALTQPQVDEVNFEPGAAMTFVAIVETRPQIELGNVDEFELPEVDGEPTEDEVNQMINDVRRRHATWTTVDRPAAMGDVVKGQVFEVGATSDGDDGDGDDGDGGEAGADGPAGQPLRAEIGGQGIDEELSLALTGLKAGQQATFKRAVPAGAAGDGEESREQEYRIEVESVEEEDLPDFDEEFAKKMGVESTDQITEGVTGQMRQMKQQEARQQRETALLDQLREAYPLELPEGVVDQEMERLLHEQASRLSAQGIDLEAAGLDWQGLAESMRPEAQKRVHNSLLLDAIGKKKGIKLDESEFERVLGSIAREQKKSSLTVRQELDAAGRLGLLRADILERQVLRQLVDGDPDPAEDGDGATDEAQDETEKAAEE